MSEFDMGNIGDIEFKISPVINHPTAFQLYKITNGWERQPVSVQYVKNSSVIVPRHYFPTWDAVQPGSVFQIGTYRVLVTNSNYDIAVCTLIKRGQTMRVLRARLRIRFGNFKRRVSITRDIWRNRL